MNASTCLLTITVVAVLAGTPTFAQQTGSAPPPETEAPQNTTPAAPAPAQEEDDPDRDVNFAQPDFALAALPTTLRVPRYKSAFRVTHRFGRPFGEGDFSDLLEDLFGLDSGAQIGLEYRFGIFRGTQIGIHRTSSTKTIELFAQHDFRTQSETFPLGISAIASIEGEDNLQEHHSPALGALLSREVGEWAAFYVEPIWVNNANQEPVGDDSDESNDTFFVGLGVRVRIRPTVYLLFEGAPRAAGYAREESVAHMSFGIEKRAGGHTFQLNFSNSFGTTLGQIARGGFTNDNWFLGFNISRKFF